MSGGDYVYGDQAGGEDGRDGHWVWIVWIEFGGPVAKLGRLLAIEGGVDGSRKAFLQTGRVQKIRS